MKIGNSDNIVPSPSLPAGRGIKGVGKMFLLKLCHLSLLIIYIFELQGE